MLVLWLYENVFRHFMYNCLPDQGAMSSTLGCSRAGFRLWVLPDKDQGERGWVDG